MPQHIRRQVERELAELEGDRHEELTRSLLSTAAVEFEDVDEVSVCGRADDKGLSSSIFEDYDGCEFAGEYGCPSDIVVERSNSYVRVNNTFDSVLGTVWEDNPKEMSMRPFDNQ